MLNFRSIEEPEFQEIHRRQNGECSVELSSLFDNEPDWGPMTLEKIKGCVNENLKKDRTTMFSIWSSEDFVGIGAWSSKWDPWGPWNHIIIWPEHRRKGYGTEAAETLLRRTFLDSPAHAIDCGVEDWNKPGIHFLKSLGFRDAGRIRLAGIREGIYHDELMFDMTKAEYLARFGGVEE